jgi:hypothetical protein
MVYHLVEPYLQKSFTDLPPEARSYVEEDFTSSGWDALSGTGRYLWLRAREDRNEVERADFSLVLTHSYWFDLQKEILAVEKKVSELRLSLVGAGEDSPHHLGLASLLSDLKTLQSKWYHPDDPQAKKQLAGLKVSLSRASAIVDITIAINFLSERTGVKWSEANLFSLASEQSNNGIGFVAIIPPWAKMSLIKWHNHVSHVALPFLRPSCTVLAYIDRMEVQELWVAGRGETSSFVSPASFLLPEETQIYLETKVKVLREDVRVERSMLFAIVQKWEESRQPIQPMAPFRSPGDISNTAWDTAIIQHEPHSAINVPLLIAGWTLKKPNRFQGYGKPLYDLLRAAHSSGLPAPTAHEVIEAFNRKRPPEIVEATSEGLKYYDGEGGLKFADRGAIKKSIRRLIESTSNSAD